MLMTRKPQRQIPTFFDDFLLKDFGTGLGLHSISANSPKVNIIETEASYELELAVPGLSKEDIKVELLGDVVIISAENNFQTQAKEDVVNYSKKEFIIGSFEKRFTLPKDKYDGDKINARADKGVLYISIPKKQEEKSVSKFIKIK